MPSDFFHTCITWDDQIETTLHIKTSDICGLNSRTELVGKILCFVTLSQLLW